ncbi:Putative efflux system component YknX [Maioricimonas rarisocia]|uniref:Efflux system component YknX n=1 Tax=Maioricimonas rarisocia TaxID=2528026 RepID=A0A517Z4P7_9PLAN|nr:HlyD family efflux transporter periplasmic adaptor subunit [Maioricimonas rarisocia]QDU37456.1 Putative efflux system component YknX [Maioricimonas rarisocia]
MKSWWRRILPIGLGIGLLALIVWAYLPKPVPVDAVSVERGPMTVAVSEDGKTRIKERFLVSTPLSGRVRRIELDPGDPVSATETLLATILPSDPDLLNPRALAEARARVNAADSAVKRAEATLAAAEAEQENAEAHHERVRRLHERDAATDDQLEEAMLEMRTARERYRSAAFAVEIARFEFDQSEAALLRSSPEGQNEETDWAFEIISPIDGVVLRVLQESSAVLSPGTPLLELGDPRNLELEVDVLSTDAVKIEPGARVFVNHWGGERPLEGTVRLVEPAAFTKISALGVEEQRVYVIADLNTSAAEAARLGDGFRFEAEIVVWEGGDVLQVPASALFRVGEEWAVFVIEDGRAQLREVELGHRNPSTAEVLEGLSARERVIIYPSDRVVDGVEVTVR